MVNKKIAVLSVVVVAITIGAALWAYLSEAPEQMTRDVSFVHSLREDATHYSIKERTFILYSEDIVLFEPIPEPKTFTFRSTLTYGGTDFLYFRVVYYTELSPNEYAQLNVEYVTLRVDVTEEGSAIWRETVRR